MRFLLIIVSFTLLIYAETTLQCPKWDINQTIKSKNRYIQKDIDKTIKLLEEGLSMRNEAIKFYAVVDAKLKADKPLSGADIRKLKSGTARLVELREKLLAQTYKYEGCIANQDKSDNKELNQAGIIISLSSVLMLYDNYMLAISLYHDNDTLRRYLDAKDAGYGLSQNEITKVANDFVSKSNRKRLKSALNWYNKTKAIDTDSLKGCKYLRQSIENSPSFALNSKDGSMYLYAKQLEQFAQYSLDSAVEFKDDSVGFGSMIFGNTMGVVATRKGKLYKDKIAHDNIASKLKAGDILLEKTPFRLTDSFIPGHWGHAAIWVGSEKELRRLGIWNHAVIKPHQSSIKDGRGVVEALRSGVEMNTLHDFMNIDDLLVIHKNRLTKSEQRKIILESMRQIGKEYDFNFDAQTTDKIFCSKLVYLAYGDQEWPTSKMLGRYTVSPDDICKHCMQNEKSLGVTLFYHDGKEVDRSEISPKLTALVGEE